VSIYRHSDADRGMRNLLAAQAHLSPAEAFTILEAYA
jgi:hypothetical protein